ncbi:MAG: two-component system sensor histidine kinase NtrB [Rickettsiales bacterium]
MSKPKNKAEEKPTKAGHIFPAPEWTHLSASLAASLAHEIRNPLLSIRGAAQLLAQVVGDEDKTLAQLIITEAARIEQLVATMDPLTPNPSQISEALNIHEVTEYVRRAASSFAGDVQISTQYDPSLPQVYVVREALIQALINLVKNSVEALKPSPAGGEGTLAAPFVPTVIIGTKYLVGERMQRPDGNKLNIQVTVTDNGPGIAEDVVPRLFTPFSSTKEHGKGLGLAIVAKIVEEHGGLIAYDAPDKGGARFTLYLPVA